MAHALIVLAIIAAVGGLIYWGVKASRKAAAAANERWADNLTLIGGTPTKSYRWTGAYQGKPVTLALSSSGGGESGPTTYYYEVGMGANGGVDHWSTSWHRPTVFNRAPEGRVLHLKNAALKAALEQAGLFNLLAAAPPHYSFTYVPKKSDLSLMFTVSGLGYLPAKAEFAEQLRLLSVVGDLAARVAGQPLGGFATQRMR